MVLSREDWNVAVPPTEKEVTVQDILAEFTFAMQIIKDNGVSAEYKHADYDPTVVTMSSYEEQLQGLESDIKEEPIDESEEEVSLLERESVNIVCETLADIIDDVFELVCPLPDLEESFDETPSPVFPPRHDLSPSQEDTVPEEHELASPISPEGYDLGSMSLPEDYIHPDDAGEVVPTSTEEALSYHESEEEEGEKEQMPLWPKTFSQKLADMVEKALNYEPPADATKITLDSVSALLNDETGGKVASKKKTKKVSPKGVMFDEMKTSLKKKALDDKTLEHAISHEETPKDKSICLAGNIPAVNTRSIESGKKEKEVTDTSKEDESKDDGGRRVRRGRVLNPNLDDPEDKAAAKKKKENNKDSDEKKKRYSSKAKKTDKLRSTGKDKESFEDSDEVTAKPKGVKKGGKGKVKSTAVSKPTSTDPKPGTSTAAGQSHKKKPGGLKYYYTDEGKRRKRPGIKALQEIVKWQKNFCLLIRKKGFERFMRGVADAFSIEGRPLRFSPMAIEALQVYIYFKDLFFLINKFIVFSIYYKIYIHLLFGIIVYITYYI